MTISKKPRYNLNLILQETGLKADTIRAWERRYGLPNPGRTEGGHRLYSDHDLSIIKWLVARQEEGMRISQAVSYWKELTSSGADPFKDQEQPRPADSLAEIDGEMSTLEGLQKKWIEYCLDYDEPHAEQILTMAFAQFPLDTVISSVVLPSLRQVGQFWYSGRATVQQEHFITEIAIKKIQALISAAPNPVHNQQILVACPPNEQHTIPSLILTLLLKQRGWETLYLGANVPLDRLSEFIKETDLDLAVLTATRISTAATLLEIMNNLVDNQIPTAYGGWIFNTIPELVDRFPGTFLGNDLPKSIEVIEDLIVNRTSNEISISIPYQNQDLVEELKKITPELNRTILAKLATTELNIHTLDIYEANRNLVRDISAVLLLGDISYLRFDLNWISDLISSRILDSGLLDTYLNIFSSAIDKILGPKGEVISRGLSNPIINPK